MSHNPVEAGAPARPRTCASCKNWDVRIARTQALKDSVARCLFPPLAGLHVVISGSGGCDKWEPLDDQTAA